VGMDLALKLADVAGFAKRKAESKKRGKLRGLGMSNTIERAAAPSFEGAEIRFDRGGTVSIFSGSINQGQGHETTFKQVVADQLGVIRTTSSTSRATPTRCSSAKAPAARARRPCRARRSISPRRK
jgi:CO/xanthine dehydrogenase Mo-binding subunit